MKISDDRERIVQKYQQRLFDEKANKELLEDLQQNWTTDNGELSDQYGFSILIGKGYKICFKGEYLMTVYSIGAAKLIARIVLNDLIANINTVKYNEQKEPITINPNPLSRVWEAETRKNGF